LIESIDTHRCFSYSKPALHTTPTGLKRGKALGMRDHYSSCVSHRFQPAVHYFSQFVPFQPNHSADLAPSGQNMGREARAGRSALVVDDVADVTEMLAVVLSHAGYNVVTAGSAPAALKAAQEQQFDVIISDIGMPDMNGYQLAREVRQLPGYEKTPVTRCSTTRSAQPKRASTPT
jgi:CheY-like chemotaxis protein